MDGWGQFLCDLINDVAKEVENDSLAVNWDEFLLIKVSSKLINTISFLNAPIISSFPANDKSPLQISTQQKWPTFAWGNGC